MKKLIILFIVLVSVNGCKKASTDIGLPNNNSIDLITTTATPGELVFAQANFKPNIGNTTLIKVGGVPTQVFVMDTNRVFFIMPVLPQGNVSIDFNNIGVSKQANLTVGSYTAITNPTEALNAVNIKMDQLITNLNDHVSSPIINLDSRYTEILVYLKQNLQTKFAAATSQEKINLVYFIQKNIPDPNDFELELADTSFYSRDELAPEERFKKVLFSYLKNCTRLAAFVFITRILASTPPPYNIIALGSLYLCINYASKVVADGKELCKILGNMINLSKTEQILPDTLVLYNNLPKAMKCYGLYRTIIQSDKSSSSFLRQFFESKRQFESFYITLMEVYTKIKDWLTGTTTTLPAYIDPVQSQSRVELHPLMGSKLSLSNFSDPNIQITYTPNNLSLNVRATSTPLIQKKHFTFNITFRDADLGFSFTETKQAVLTKHLSIGDDFEGGKVFYIDSTGHHGLVSATSDQSTSSNWANAFSVCTNYRGGGYSDWFLPTIIQLDSMYRHRMAIGNFNSSCTNANFGECSYWSATENGNNFAWNLYFVTGGWWSNYGRDGLARVRAIRAF